jgi:hypothetical protein
VRTQDWKAGNAPAGPPLLVRCTCGGTLATLGAGAAAGRARGDGKDVALCCGTCGRTVRLEVRDVR